MRKTFTLAFLSLAVLFASAQRKKTDSLITVLKSAQDNGRRIAVLKQLAGINNRASVIIEYAQQGIDLAKKLDNLKEEKLFLFALAVGYGKSYNYPKYLETGFKGLELSRELKDETYTCKFLNSIALGYSDGSESHKAIYYGLTGLHIAERIKNMQLIGQLCNNISGFYIEANLLDSALYFRKKSYAAASEVHDPQIGYPISGLGQIENMLNHTNLALSYYRQAITAFKKSEFYRNTNLINMYAAIAGIYKKNGHTDSAFYYANMGYNLTKQNNELYGTYETAKLLSDLYAVKNEMESLRYYKIASIANDSLNSAEKTKQFQIVAANEQQHETDIKNAAEASKKRLRLYGALLALALAIIIAGILWNNNKKQQKANKLLESQKRQIQDTLQNLKTTQTQLIQSEKMASLGELTAGIAHEIQNPLNFVNNFSEVNAELIGEMKQEIDRGDLEEIKAIATDIEENSKKISMHGKRADAIVKGMLQHSQSGSGVKELTNINMLADEYMRLSYHGLRSKDKTFNAEMVAHFDEKLPLVNVIPQDIGRVLLNLFNNAFYAVHQKVKMAGPEYKPEVSVETFFLPLQGVWGLKVKDNGIGIPDHIKDKIMQPFFTTKPTGEGTGLGLSLTYDMVVKGHGGSINIEGKKGEGATFTIKLPVEDKRR